MMAPLTADERMIRNAALFNEVAQGSDWLIASLAAAGFGDFCTEDLLVCAALSLGYRTADNVARALQMSPQAVNCVNGSLISRGYLAPRESSDDSGPVVVATERGKAAGSVVWDGIGIKRWADFAFRRNDIIISSPHKNGVTWTQTICALLIFQTPKLPEPLGELSPWLDGQFGLPHDRICAQLGAQEHRRFIKTHLPIIEIPVDPRASYIIVGRHPLDAAISLYHQNHRGTGKRAAEGTSRPEPPGPREWLLRWIDQEGTGQRTTLPRVLDHMSDAWTRRGEQNVILLHYEDLRTNLRGEMRNLAERLGISIPEAIWPTLVKAATFEEMRAAADRLQPFDATAFFRRGTSGYGPELLSSTELAHYYERAAQLAPADLLTWLHRPSGNG